ncbi:putative F-box/LRR-repeat protein At3g18150 [Rhododendron vialii]|uniref:putative F-box/LRR-repeat protein At3g18150 n=1 Tax=Rhododendron vialii TaxID=182163 RepID=UPI00265F0E61|nr:putative F-box/LRR-repeat protein At3g18150 [Rhododendron vialii]
MGDARNQSHISRRTNPNESAIVTGKTSGSHHNRNPRTKRRKTNKRRDQEEEEDEEAQTLELEPDRLSELPDSLLLHILSLLPSFNQVIRAGTLSKRWLHLWTFVPNLVFTRSSSNPKKFVSGVSKTLTQSRVSKVEKFSILVPYSAAFSSDVDSWLLFAARNGAADLSLRFFNSIPGNVYVLPQVMCTNSRIKVLELANCVVKPVGLVSWNALKRLYFYGVMLSDAAMEGIVSGCPVLEILHVYRYVFKGLKVRSRSLRELVLSGYVHHFDEDDCNAYLEISAPNLRTLTISSCFYTWDVRLEDVTSLVRADLSFYLDIDDDAADVEEYDKYLDLLLELMEKLHHVEELKLATWCIQVLSVLEVRGWLSPSLNCKSLTLDTHVVDCDLPGLARLLDISPYLETLVISTETLSPSEFFVGGALYVAYSFNGKHYFQLRKSIPEGLLLHLKNVKIFGFRRVHWEVDLVQFLMKNAKVLENVNVYLQREGFQCQSECCVWQETFDEELDLSASSPHAVVRFFESPEEFKEALKLETMLTLVE